MRTALAVDDSPDLDNTFSRTKKKGAKLNLRSKAAGRKKLRFVNLKTFTPVQTGTVRVRVVSKGKLVIIDGLGVGAV